MITDKEKEIKDGQTLKKGKRKENGRYERRTKGNKCSWELNEPTRLIRRNRVKRKISKGKTNKVWVNFKRWKLKKINNKRKRREMKYR